MPAPRISIVVPAFNREAYLSATLDGVLAQTRGDWELVIVDDGSTDGTAEIAASYARRDARIRVVSQPNSGISGARNRGYSEVTPITPHVIFLDSDDVWHPALLETLASRLDGDPRAVGSYCLARSVDAQGVVYPKDDLPRKLAYRRQVSGGRLVPVPHDVPTRFEAMLVDNWVVTPGLCLIRRKAFDAVGGFEPGLPVAEDWDLMVRLTRHGDLLFTEQVLLDWRRHDSNTSANARFVECYYEVRRRSVLSPDNTPAQRRVALRAFHIAVRGSLREAVRQARRLNGMTAARALRRGLYGAGQFARALPGLRAHKEPR